MSKLLTLMPKMAESLYLYESKLLCMKMDVAVQESKAIDPESKMAVEKQLMAFTASNPKFEVMKNDTAQFSLQVTKYQRLYLMYREICDKIDYNTSEVNYTNFEETVSNTVSEMEAGLVK